MTIVSDKTIIAQWMDEHIGEVYVHILESPDEESLYEMMVDFVDRFEDFDIIQDKFDKDAVEEAAIDNFNFSRWCRDEFGYDQDDLHQLVDGFETELEKASLEYNLTIPIVGWHWIDFPDREGSEAMMKLVQELPNGKLYIDLKKQLVFVPRS
jgi:hypothetical protein